MLRMLNAEDLVTKAVGTYLSEKRLLESQLSTESVPNDETPLVPEVSVEPPCTTPLLDPPSSIEPIEEVTNEANEDSGPLLGSESVLSENLVSQVSLLHTCVYTSSNLKKVFLSKLCMRSVQIHKNWTDQKTENRPFWQLHLNASNFCLAKVCIQ